MMLSCDFNSVCRFTNQGSFPISCYNSSKSSERIVQSTVSEY